MDAVGRAMDRSRNCNHLAAIGVGHCRGGEVVVAVAAVGEGVEAGREQGHS